MGTTGSHRLSQRSLKMKYTPSLKRVFISELMSLLVAYFLPLAKLNASGSLESLLWFGVSCMFLMSGSTTHGGGEPQAETPG